MYINKLDDIANKYNDRYHSTIKVKPVAVKSSTHIDFKRKNNKEHPQLKIDDNVRVSKYENIFAKGYVSNHSTIFRLCD